MTWQHDSVRGNRHKRGYGVKWERKRLRVLARDEYLCQPCKRVGKVTPATQVDHKIGKAQGERLGMRKSAIESIKNLESICDDCHKSKTAIEAHFNPFKGCDEEGEPYDPTHPWNNE